MLKMGIFDYYNKWGKNGMKTTRTDFIDMVGLEGIQEIVKQVFLGGNVRDAENSFLPNPYNQQIHT